MLIGELLNCQSDHRFFTYRSPPFISISGDNVVVIRDIKCRRTSVINEAILVSIGPSIHLPLGIFIRCLCSFLPYCALMVCCR